jgi:hypothetical protein
LYKNYELSNQLSISLEKIDSIEKEKEKLKSNVEISSNSLSDLRENYSMLINKDKTYYLLHEKNFNEEMKVNSNLNEIANLKKELKEKDERIKKLESMMKEKKKTSPTSQQASTTTHIQSVSTSNSKGLQTKITTSLVHTRKSFSPPTKVKTSQRPLTQEGKVQRIVKHYSRVFFIPLIGKDPEFILPIIKSPEILIGSNRSSIDIKRYPYEIETLKKELESIQKNDQINKSLESRSSKKVEEPKKESELYHRIFQRYF